MKIWSLNWEIADIGYVQFKPSLDINRKDQKEEKGRIGTIFKGQILFSLRKDELPQGGLCCRQ